jgi:branched-chain amino acid transport system permease protein
MGYLTTIIILGGISVIATLGLAILTGYTGMFSIGHAGFMALGGYMAAVLNMQLHVPFILALLLGGLFSGACSLIIGFPSFRSKLVGDYFAIATFGFSEAIRLVLTNTYPIIGGAYGLTDIPMRTNAVNTLLITLGAVLLAHAFVTSQYGKNCIAVSQDALAAQMMGVDVLKTKLIALFISAMYAGVAGGLLGFYLAYLTPSLFTTTRSSDLLAAVVFGGMQSLIGPLIASFVLVAVPQLLYSFIEWRLVVYGLLFVLVMVFRPQGLLGYTEMNFTVARAWLVRFIRRILRKPAPEAGQG